MMNTSREISGSKDRIQQSGEESVIEIINLKKSFGAQEVLKNISLNLYSRKFNRSREVWFGKISIDKMHSKTIIL